MSKSTLGIFITVVAVVLVAAGVVWGIRSGGFSAPAPSASSAAVASPRPVDPVALEREIEALQAMRNHLLPPLPATKPDAFRTEQQGMSVQLPTPPQAMDNTPYRYTAPAPTSPTPSPAYPYLSPATSSYSANPTYVYTYSYSPVENSLPQNATVFSPPPAPVFLAAPGTRTYTVTTNRRFCEYVKGTSMVLLSGYPFPQDIEIYSQDILQWSMTSVTFRLPFSFPAGSYAVTVRGYQKYGYCDDVRVGFIKVQ